MKTCGCRWCECGLGVVVIIIVMVTIFTAIICHSDHYRHVFAVGNTHLEIQIFDLLAYALGAGILVRFIISLLRSHELVFEAEKDKPLSKDIVLAPHLFKDDGFPRTLIKDFLGCHPSVKVKDFFLPSILGFIELLIYPALIFVGEWKVIGGWLGIKTVARWEMWGKDRNTYNRFLIGNALVILAAIIIANTGSVSFGP